MSNIVPIGKDLSKAAITNTIKINTIDDLQRLGELLAKSGFFEDCLLAAQACVKILCGAELGLTAFDSMVGIHLIKGKPAIGANLMAAAVKRSDRYDYRVVELNDRTCKITFFERGKEIGVSEFSAADAQKAGTQNMGKFPRNMLFARCLSNGVRCFCPDIFLGSPVYTPEELGAVIDSEDRVIELGETQVVNESEAETVEKAIAQQPVGMAPTTPEVWRTSKTPIDAITWGATVRPDWTPAQLQKLFDSVPAVNGKKAPAFVEKVLEIADQF